jgi:ribosomal protein S18 acetylase RimI-like enzyme
MTARVEVLDAVSDEIVTALGRLLPQLSRSAPPLDRAGLERIVAHPANTVLVARGSGGEVLGMLTLVIFPIPSGMRVWIEDVVVDEAARGRGVGAVLTKEALCLAGEAGARTVDLTSRPSRAAANRLYQRLGFQPRDSRVYRYLIEQ